MTRFVHDPLCLMRGRIKCLGVTSNQMLILYALHWFMLLQSKYVNNPE